VAPRRHGPGARALGVAPHTGALRRALHVPERASRRSRGQALPGAGDGPRGRTRVAAGLARAWRSAAGAESNVELALCPYVQARRRPL
jgi:hypothetical protein